MVEGHLRVGGEAEALFWIVITSRNGNGAASWLSAAKITLSLCFLTRFLLVDTEGGFGSGGMDRWHLEVELGVETGGGVEATPQSLGFSCYGGFEKIGGRELDVSGCEEPRKEKFGTSRDQIHQFFGERIRGIRFEGSYIVPSGKAQAGGFSSREISCLCKRFWSEFHLLDWAAGKGPGREQ
ncbi:hypothetical protein HWI79_2910 [Cryptosporidium felis]|nr:hypothetical protein HWI79_2910 [Cryptosporidium felis]